MLYRIVIEYLDGLEQRAGADHIGLLSEVVGNWKLSLEIIGKLEIGSRPKEYFFSDKITCGRALKAQPLAGSLGSMLCPCLPRYLVLFFLAVGYRY